jgi:beta-mannosidase
MARARLLGTAASRPLTGSWELAALAPGTAVDPPELEAARPDWLHCAGPMTAAAALRDTGIWKGNAARDFDADDWWYRCRFAAPDRTPSSRLRFDGLATIADAWLNGRHLLHCASMFLAHGVDVGAVLERDNELLLRFHALSPLLRGRHPRPRWRTALVTRQALRCYRTTLLGRISTWCPAVAPVGPWRPVSLEPGPVRIASADVKTQLRGSEGLLHLRVEVVVPSVRVSRAVVTIGDATFPVGVEAGAPGVITLETTCTICDVRRWWPHTHGTPTLYGVRLDVDLDGVTCEVDLGHVGFRSLAVDRGADGRGFGLIVNGTPVFCRGVCWTPLDLVSLTASAAEYRTALELLRDAGMNMVRIGGTMAYEDEAFHRLCDELGILVWQDFMFANMDYPWQDESFRAAAIAEAKQVLNDRQTGPSLAVVCGNSEVDQQAAMLGLSSEARGTGAPNQELFELVRASTQDAAWLPSTPGGGTLPFHPDSGVAHYYGVGAFRRPLVDARLSGVRFAAECLAFSNVPEPVTVDSMRDDESDGLGPAWKPPVPRDPGAQWDFEDVRDHYVNLLFGVDPAGIRAVDPDRYLALGRVAIGEVMSRTFAEWRRPASPCRGGLVWLARDFVSGAGWGIIDATGIPKAAYWYLKRALAPVFLIASDEGLNGLWLHAVNDSAVAIDAELTVRLLREGDPHGDSVRTRLRISPHAAQSVHADGLFDRFRDLTCAYRLGAPAHDAVTASLSDTATGALLSTAYWRPVPLSSARADVGLTAELISQPGGDAVVVSCERWAQAVAIEIERYLPADNYFHLEPGERRIVPLRRLGDTASPRGRVTALNSDSAVSFGQVEALRAG